MAHGGSAGRSLCSEIPAVLGGGLAGVGATLQRLGWAFLERGGMDCGAGPVASVDEGLARRCSAITKLPRKASLSMCTDKTV